MVQKEVLRLHRDAMALAERADELAREDETERARVFLRRAFQKERTAASSLANKKDLEPTRSVLFRSAASLALECSEYEEAANLIIAGLDGNPPEEIRLELRSLMPAAKRSHATGAKLRRTNGRGRKSNPRFLASPKEEASS